MNRRERKNARAPESSGRAGRGESGGQRGGRTDRERERDREAECKNRLGAEEQAENWRFVLVSFYFFMFIHRM